jgi:3-oxoacyl-[acyl-carrier protein] reductase
MDKKTAIVTGGSKGLGRGIAQVFAAEGANVLIVARNSSDGEDVVREITLNGDTASFLSADVSLKSDVQSIVKTAIDRYGTIDILVCNAGIFPSSNLEDMQEEEWDNVNSVNLKSVFLCVKECLEEMKRNETGRVLLTSSITGPITGYPGWAHYGATKAGMLGFMRTAAIELAVSNITINAVLPGNIMTEGLDDLGEDYIQSMIDAIPMGKLGTPEDVAHAMLFLSSEEANFITGQTLVVDGGQTLPE